MTDKYAELRAALELGPTEGYEYDSNQTPFYNDIDGFSRGGNCNGTYYVFAPSFTVPGDEHEYDGPVLTERASKADAKFICAANPEAIRALLAERDALREALRPLAEIDLAQEPPNDFAWFVLRARAALAQEQS